LTGSSSSSSSSSESSMTPLLTLSSVNSKIEKGGRERRHVGQNRMPAVQA
jgi:hypothetical protein